MVDAKTHPFALHGKIRGDPVVAGTKTVLLDRAERFFCCATERRAGFLRVSPKHHFSTPGHKVHQPAECELIDRKSTRLNSSHTVISYAVFCLKKKKMKKKQTS